MAIGSKREEVARDDYFRCRTTGTQGVVRDLSRDVDQFPTTFTFAAAGHIEDSLIAAPPGSQGGRAERCDLTGRDLERTALGDARASATTRLLDPQSIGSG